MLKDLYTIFMCFPSTFTGLGVVLCLAPFVKKNMRIWRIAQVFTLIAFICMFFDTYNLIKQVKPKPPHTDYHIEIYKDSVSIYSSDTLVKKVPFENLEETLINDNL